MDPNSGKIFNLPEDFDDPRLIKIPDSEVQAVRKMNRHERRRWAAMNRKRDK